MNLYEIREHCFVEYEDYPATKELKKKIDEKLFQRGFCVEDDKGNIYFKCTGLIYSKGMFLIIFPKGYKIPDGQEELFEHIRNLIQVLVRYRDEGKVDEFNEELYGETGGFSGGLEGAIWLLNDYINNGYIRRFERQRAMNKGNNINWPLTLKKINPIFSQRRPIYLDYYTTSNTVNQADMLYHLHRFVIQQCFKKIGWLFEIQYEESQQYDYLKLEKERAIYILEQELRATFNDRERNLIRYLIQFFLGTKETTSKTFQTFATTHFHTIWEKICAYIFNNEYHQYYEEMPQPKWCIPSKAPKPRQKPDILYKEEKSFFILDAKYYDTDKSLPGWHDLVKQFYYYFTLRKKFEDLETVNILLFPKVLDEILDMSGYIEIEGQKDLGKIYVVNLDIYSAMKSYATFTQKRSYRDELRKCYDNFSK